MPSPFPGMDPYLEHPAFFPGVHDRFIAYLCDGAMQRLHALRLHQIIVAK